MCNAIPCTGNTADQAVNTVHIQLGAAKHLTRPLTVRKNQSIKDVSGLFISISIGALKLN